MSNIQRLKAFKKHKSGAYGEVWVGEQAILGRQVALKIIKVEMADEATARDHALALARLNHPNIVTIHNLELAELPDGQLAEAIVMEWLPGPTFGELLQQGSISKEQLFRIMDASIQGVRHMHLNNVFHGDLHPGNVIVGDTFVKIIDVSATDSRSTTRFSTISKDTLIAKDVASLAYNLRFGVYRCSCDFSALENETGKLGGVQSIDEVEAILGMLKHSIRAMYDTKMDLKPYQNRYWFGMDCPSWTLWC